METNIHTTTWNFRLLKKLLSQNLVVLVKLIVDGNWIYSFENISSSMFLAHCDTLKKYEHKLHWCGVIFECFTIWSFAIIQLLIGRTQRKKYVLHFDHIYYRCIHIERRRPVNVIMLNGNLHCWKPTAKNCSLLATWDWLQKHVNPHRPPC